MHRTAAATGRHLLITGLVPLLAACGSGDGPGSTDATATVRDSAGIRIVTNPDVPLPVWTVDTVPFLTIGTVEGADGQDLGNPWASAGLPEGGVAVADAASGQVRLYDAQGTHVRSTGGPGEGPGEFGTVGTIYVGAGDSLLVSDVTRPRITVLGPGGDYARTIPLERLAGTGVPRLNGVLADSVAVFRAFYSGWGEPGSTVRDSTVVLFRPLNRPAYRRVGRWLDPEAVMMEVEDDGGPRPPGAEPPAGTIRTRVPAPLSTGVRMAVTEDALWVTDCTRYRMELFDATGRMRAVVRLDRPATPTSAEVRARYRDFTLGMSTGDASRRRQAALLERAPWAGEVAVCDAMERDAAGRVWVREYRPPWDVAPPTWRIFDADGQQLATATLPPGLLLHEIGPDWILARWRGAMDVPLVGKFRIRRPD